MEARIDALADALIAKLGDPSNTKAIRNFAMMFGNSHVGEDSAAIAAENLSATIDRNEVTTLARIMESHHQPFRKAKAPGMISPTAAGQSIGRRFVKQQNLQVGFPVDLPETEEELQRALTGLPEAARAVFLLHMKIRKSLRDPNIIPLRLIFYNNSSKYCRMKNEADVADRTLMVIVRPCLDAGSYLLQKVHPGKRLYVQAQDPPVSTTNTRLFKADQVLAEGEDSPTFTTTGKSVAVVEYKGPKFINRKNWKELMYSKEPQTRYLVPFRAIERMGGDTRLWVAQLLHYAILHQAEHTMAIDCKSFIPIIWKPAAGQTINTGAAFAATGETAVTAQTYSLRRKRGKRNKQLKEDQSLSFAPEENVPTVCQSLLHLITGGLNAGGFAIL